jgi:molecular chaperone DnaK
MSGTMGIDLGTYNSAAAFALGSGKVIMVESKYGPTLYGKNFPSFVLFDHEGKPVRVGKLAKAELGFNPLLVVWGVKRLVGLSYEEAKERGEFNRFRYEIEEGSDGSIVIKVGEKRYTPTEILKFILQEIKEDAENPKINPMIGTSIDKVVITRPAYFDATRTQYIIQAAEEAGFKEIETIAEPTAAAIWYGVKEELRYNKNFYILTFDMGAGTLDTSVTQFQYIEGGLIPGEEATSGNEHLGGIDMDDKIIDHILNAMKFQEIRSDLRSFSTLKDEVERGKITLSKNPSLSIVSIPITTPSISKLVELTQVEMVNILSDLLEKSRGPIGVALNLAGVKADSIEKVLLVGGPTYMPCVRKVVIEELDKLGAKKELLAELENIDKQERSFNPMECVARGAALKAGKVMDVATTVSECGYGTILYPVPGNPDYYDAIIPANSNYPIGGTKTVQHGSSQGILRVPMPLVKKVPDTERSTREHIVYKYFNLGEYDLYIEPTSEHPLVEITLELTKEKVLVTTLGHKHNSVRFEGLDRLTGREVQLQEEWPPPPVPDPDPNHRELREWTRKQLEAVIHVAQMLVNDPRFQISSVKKQSDKTASAIRRAVESDLKKPNQHCPLIFDAILELLNALTNAKKISPEDFQRHKDELRNI